MISQKQKESNKKYWATHKEILNIKSKINKQSPIFREKQKESNKKYYFKNIDKIKVYNKKNWLKRQYGITLDQYNQMLTVQDNRCAICNNPFTKRPCVDHNHLTGKVRQLLCVKCNSVLGFSEDNILILQNAIRYLEKWRK